MNPESILFSAYERQARQAAEEQNRDLQLTAALDIIEPYVVRAEQQRVIYDAEALKALIQMGLPSDMQRISEAVATKNGSHMNVTPPYEKFDYSGVRFESCIGLIQREPNSPYSLYKIVVMPEGGLNLPDKQGVYLARHKRDHSVRMFNIRGIQPAYIQELTRDDDRQAVADEFQKAANALRPGYANY